MFRGIMKVRFVRNNDGVSDILLIQEAGEHTPIQRFIFMNVLSETAKNCHDGQELFVDIRPALALCDDAGASAG